MYACLGVTSHLHFWQNDRGLSRASAVTRGWNGHRVRVSTQSWLRRIKFSCCSCRDLNLQPFDHKPNALTNKLSWLIYCKQTRLKTLCSAFCLWWSTLREPISADDSTTNNCSRLWKTFLVHNFVANSNKITVILSFTLALNKEDLCSKYCTDKTVASDATHKRQTKMHVCLHCAEQHPYQNNIPILNSWSWQQQQQQTWWETKQGRLPLQLTRLFSLSLKLSFCTDPFRASSKRVDSDASYILRKAVVRREQLRRWRS